ncbi:monoacylglycerol lipase [Holotrichia oblita]|uniref:Monoacylglycerol lipase n=1 Tax=Holotrichia oblita TaxID=644536 RepID=A0ACB9TFZ1_HOLOL|nr:monoacylglycerol lipase [Holotrichia oblita]
MQIIEIKIPVAWGHVAVKTWGNPTDEPVIIIHGLIDNAGSFDTLIPLLPQNFYYICVDLPGHGLSSHLPLGVPIFYFNFIYAIKYTADYFKKQKYILLGHSFGGRLCILFTQLFPDAVSKIAILDSGYISPSSPEEHFQCLIDGYDLVKKTESFKNNKAPNYSYDEIIKKIVESRFGGTLTFKTAQQLAERMVKKVGDDKYELTYDRRLRSIVYPSYSDQYVNEILKKYPVRCPAISIYTSTSRKHLPTTNTFFQVPNFQWVEVQGHHHSHHTDPNKFANILTKFLLNEKSKL